MRPKLARLRGLLHRYRLDRRLPPPVVDLVRTATRLRAEDRRASLAAHRSPVVGNGAGAEVVRLGRRRVAAVGPPSASVDELAVTAAHRVERLLADAGVDAFLVGRDGDRLELGVPVGQRPAALQALAAADEPGWCLQWFDRGSDGLTDLREPSQHARRRVLRARRWRVFRAHTWGERVLGPVAGVDLTFWAIGSSGEYELVGTRGHHRFHPDSPDTVETVAGRRFRGKQAFPVTGTLESLDVPVDVVFTWVDGADERWLESFRVTAAAHGRVPDEAALDPARYRSRDELRYALRSVWAYCGWVRRIWVVTAGQVPSWLDVDDRVRVVDHGEIMPPDALPTFNSHAIEASLHHIEGLAEHFVYFNDDMFAARPLRPEHFFTPNGLAKVFQSGARVHGFEGEDTLAVDTAALRGRELLRERFGRVVVHKPLHSPYPLRRSTLEWIDAEFADAVGRTVRSRFRAPEDLSIAASFGQHVGVATAASVFGEIRSEYVHVESGRLAWHLDRIRLGDDVDTFCINETRDGGGRPDREALIAAHLEACFPVAAPWERTA